MQEHQPGSGAAEASTKPPRIRPPLASMRLETPNQCDICGKARATRKHVACSRIRQQRKDAEWATYMAEQAATRAAKQEKRRYAR